MRKILACAARMAGARQGMLASALRGSLSAKLSQAGLDQLSHTASSSGMTQDEILLYVDALVAAACCTSRARLPTISLTPTGVRVRRELATVELRLPPPYTARLTLPFPHVPTRRDAGRAETSTVDDTYSLYERVSRSKRFARSAA